MATKTPQRTLWDFHTTIRGRWWRTAAFYGQAPGSHTGFWRTHAYGLRGWNYRIGSLLRCLTVLVHTRPVRPDEEPGARVAMNNRDAKYTPTEPLQPHYPDEEPT